MLFLLATLVHASPYTVVLGTAQDAGHPQAACQKACCTAAWTDPKKRHRVASLGLVNPETRQRWLLDATPDLPDQLRVLDTLAPPAADGRVLDGIFLTHAHIGHYTGLMYLGHEVMGAKDVPVFAMPRMTRFLSEHGPWDRRWSPNPARLAADLYSIARDRIDHIPSTWNL